MFQHIFKSKQQKELERNIVIQKTLVLYRQQIKKLELHERGYSEKAIRAKKTDDRPNFQRLCGMVAQTINERRGLESQLLCFETMLQTRDKVRLIGEFANGMKAMMKSIRESWGVMDATEILTDVEKAVSTSVQMESAMNIILERISASQSCVDIPEGGITANQVEVLLSEKVLLEKNNLDNQIENELLQLNNNV